MTDKTIALVSGANRGLGLAIAAGLARENIHVLLGSRDLARGEAAAASLLATEGLKVQPIELDTTDESSMAEAAKQIGWEFGKLDILVNNAGLALDFNQDISQRDNLRQTFEVNVFGTMRLSDMMLPLLCRSTAPRIVNVSSSLASFGLRSDPGWQYAAFQLPVYQASKAAVNAITVSQATLFAEHGIKVNAVCPGYTATDATQHQGRPVDEGARIAVEYALLGSDGPTGCFMNDGGTIPW